MAGTTVAGTMVTIRTVAGQRWLDNGGRDNGSWDDGDYENGGWTTVAGTTGLERW